MRGHAIRSQTRPSGLWPPGLLVCGVVQLRLIIYRVERRDYVRQHGRNKHCFPASRRTSCCESFARYVPWLLWYTRSPALAHESFRSLGEFAPLYCSGDTTYLSLSNPVADAAGPASTLASMPEPCQLSLPLLSTSDKQSRTY